MLRGIVRTETGSRIAGLFPGDRQAGVPIFTNLLCRCSHFRQLGVINGFGAGNWIGNWIGKWVGQTCPCEFNSVLGERRLGQTWWGTLGVVLGDVCSWHKGTSQGGNFNLVVE